MGRPGIAACAGKQSQILWPTRRIRCEASPDYSGSLVRAAWSKRCRIQYEKKCRASNRHGVPSCETSQEGTRGADARRHPSRTRRTINRIVLRLTGPPSAIRHPPSAKRTRRQRRIHPDDGRWEKYPTPKVGLIVPGPSSNGQSPHRTRRHFKRTWFIVAVAMSGLIILAVLVHW